MPDVPFIASSQKGGVMHESQVKPHLLGAVVMAVLIIAANGIGIYLNYKGYHTAPQAVALVATAMIAFAGLLVMGQAESGEITDAAMRTAIAGTVVTEYLVLMAIVVLYPPVDKAGEMPSLSNQMLASFTNTTGLVVAFYFGASAVVEGIKKMGSGVRGS